MTPGLKRDIVNFLKQKSISAARGKEEKIAALQALGRDPGAGQPAMPQAPKSPP